MDSYSGDWLGHWENMLVVNWINEKDVPWNMIPLIDALHFSFY